MFFHIAGWLVGAVYWTRRRWCVGLCRRHFVGRGESSRVAGDAAGVQSNNLHDEQGTEFILLYRSISQRMSLAAADWLVGLCIRTANHIAGVTHLSLDQNRETRDVFLRLLQWHRTPNYKMSAETPWHASYPAPRTVAPSLSRQELLQWFREGKRAGTDFVLVDVRRTDFEVCRGITVDIRADIKQGGTIQGSLNLPVQSLYPTIPTLYSLLSNGKVKHVVWYCG